MTYKSTELPDFCLLPPTYETRAVPERKSSQGRRPTANATKEFIAWDGEAVKDAGYCLFGNSKGEYVRGKTLGSKEMLELIIEAGERHPDAFHVSYVFGYDVNHIIQDIGWVKVAVLHKTGSVDWGGYRLKHIPSKSFTVTKLGPKKESLVTVRIDDIFSYFRGRYDKVLIKYKIGTPEEQKIVTKGKDDRNEFYWADIEEIQTYWELELKLMVQLMDSLRTDINSAGFYIGQWHGPGALAAYALKQHKMMQFKKETPDEILEPVRIAYSGGWFERFKCGKHDGKIYTADINSAYAYAISLLPNLANGKWEHVKNPDREMARAVRFGVFHIRIEPNVDSDKEFLATCAGVPLPLFLRDRRKSNSHPVVVDGWYWSPEAAHVVGHPFAQFLEAWIYHDDGTEPFAWVREMYEDRLVMISEGNPAEKALKYTMASLYGRVAQRAGWDQEKRTAPRWHQLDWAGYITSVCRSMLYEASFDVSLQNGLISNDTDGVMSTVPFGKLRNGTSEALGAWKLEEFDGVIYIQNGVYWLRKDDEEWWDKHPKEDRNGYPWLAPKVRGIPTGKITRAKEGPELALAALAKDGVIEYKRNNFVGYGAALQGRRSDWRRWMETDHRISTYSSGNRQHVEALCRLCRSGGGMVDGLHDLALVPSRDMESQPHSLPWLEPEKESVWEMVRHMIDRGDI